MDGYNEMNEAIDRLNEIDPYGLGVFKNDAEAKEYARLYDRLEELMTEYTGGKYRIVSTGFGNVVMTNDEFAQYRALTGRDKMVFAADIAVLNGTIERNPLKDDEPEAPAEPEKSVISAADVFQFAATTLKEVYEKANAVAPNGSTVDIEDVKNFVIDRINYGGCDNWKESTWIAYIASWKPVYTLEDGTKTDLDGALANAERIEEEKRQETGLPYPDLPVIPGINEPEDKEDAPADAVDKDAADDAADKNQGTADKAPATPVAPVAPVVPETPAQPVNGGNTAADQAAADAAAKAEADAAAEEAAKKAAEEWARQQAENDAKRAAAEEAARAGQEGIYDAGDGTTITVNGDGEATITWDKKPGDTVIASDGSVWEIIE